MFWRKEGTRLARRRLVMSEEEAEVGAGAALALATALEIGVELKREVLRGVRSLAEASPLACAVS